MVSPHLRPTTEKDLILSTTPANPRLRPEPELAAAPDRVPLPSWKNEISSRAAARRARTARVPENQPSLPGLETAPSPASIAARVAERYARIPSYREMLAAQAAAAPPGVEPTAEPAAVPEPLVAVPHQEPHPEPLQRELLRYSVSTDSLPAVPVTPAQARVARSVHPSIDTDFCDPFEEAVVEPAQPLPARLIENPRELVAPRKARPRLAEGPLREDQKIVPDEPGAEPAAKEGQSMGPVTPPKQLRTPDADPDAATPRTSVPPRSQWLSIQLDTEVTVRQEKSSPAPGDDLPLHVASFEDRFTAGLVDCGLVASAFLLFVVVFAFSTTHFPAGRIAVAGAAIILLAMALLYQYLFFTLTDATPGMSYARIALCTFADENPTRAAMRGRIAALLLSALPLGLGFLWAIFDEDSLGWHDRITRTYQRSYRER
jgi:uncharacterized RDD family membrane protein YckC